MDPLLNQFVPHHIMKKRVKQKEITKWTDIKSCPV